MVEFVAIKTIDRNDWHDIKSNRVVANAAPRSYRTHAVMLVTTQQDTRTTCNVGPKGIKLITSGKQEFAQGNHPFTNA